MTGFQTLLSRLGAATALLAFASGLFGGSTDMAVVGGSLLLLLAGVRHFTGILPHVGMTLAPGWWEWRCCFWCWIPEWVRISGGFWLPAGCSVGLPWSGA